MSIELLIALIVAIVIGNLIGSIAGMKIVACLEKRRAKKLNDALAKYNPDLFRYTSEEQETIKTWKDQNTKN